MYPDGWAEQFKAASCNEEDDGYEPNKPLSASRHRWLAILDRYEIPPHVHAAHMVWVYAYHSWLEAEEYAAKAQEAWEKFKGGGRHDWAP